MELFYILLVLLITARLFGEAAIRLGQPELLGEILAGITLGLAINYFQDYMPLLNSLDDSNNALLAAIKDLAIFFLMLMGGLELRPREMAKASRGGVIIALGGIVLPFILAWILGSYFFPPSPLQSAQILFLATALSVTAVPVAIKVLMNTGTLETAMGRAIVSAAVIDDVLSLILLAVMTQVFQTGSLPGGVAVFLMLANIAIFFIITTFIGHYLFPLLGRLLKRSAAEEFELSMLLTTAFAFGVLAELLGMHFILGAFQAGLFFRRDTIDQRVFDGVTDKVRGLTNGFLAPIFFASVGLHLDLSALLIVPGLSLIHI